MYVSFKASLMCKALCNWIVIEVVSYGVVANLANLMLVYDHVMLGFELNKFTCSLICASSTHVTLYLYLV
jgi:hypothetical protein